MSERPQAGERFTSRFTLMDRGVRLALESGRPVAQVAPGRPAAIRTAQVLLKRRRIGSADTGSKEVIHVASSVEEPLAPSERCLVRALAFVKFALMAWASCARYDAPTLWRRILTSTSLPKCRPYRQSIHTYYHPP